LLSVWGIWVWVDLHTGEELRASEPNSRAKQDWFFVVSAGRASPSSRGLWGSNALLLSTRAGNRSRRVRRTECAGDGHVHRRQEVVGEHEARERGQLAQSRHLRPRGERVVLQVELLEPREALRRARPVLRCSTATKKLRIVMLGFGTAR
jgi:hypothetical protein